LHAAGRQSFQDLQPQVAHLLVEFPREDRIAIMDHEAVCVVRRNGLPQLLQRPGRCRMRCHVGMQNAAGRVCHQHKDIEEAKGGRDHDAEITGYDRLGMVADKSAPTLGHRAFASVMVHALGHVLAYRAW
jgi:hypothetical protein